MSAERFEAVPRGNSWTVLDHKARIGYPFTYKESAEEVVDELLQHPGRYIAGERYYAMWQEVNR